MALLIATFAQSASADDILATKAPPISPGTPSSYDWIGVYVGGYLGYAWGNSNWTTAADISGSLNLTQRLDPFNEAGSWFAGLQFGYDYMLPNRVVIGAVADATFPSFQNLSGISIGGTSIFNSPTNGPESHSETMLSSGTVRARVGYAPGNWLFYGTGGFAWTYDRLTLTQLITGTTDTPFLWRFGWAPEAGVEFPVAPHWTASRRKMLRAIRDLGNVSVAPSALPTPMETEPIRPDDAERRQLTVMFTHLVGSTALSTKLDPED